MKFPGLTVVAYLSDGSGYSWKEARVWRHDTSSRLYYKADFGCSCNSPFERCRFRNISDHNLDELEPSAYGLRAMTRHIDAVYGQFPVRPRRELRAQFLRQAWQAVQDVTAEQLRSPAVVDW